jgi:hypothetical protein
MVSTKEKHSHARFRIEIDKKAKFENDPAPRFSLDQLFTYMRRFDEDVTHTLILTSVTPLPLAQPDLRRSVLPDVPYSTDVFKSNLERLYASGGTGIYAVWGRSTDYDRGALQREGGRRTFARLISSDGSSAWRSLPWWDSSCC